MKLIFFGTPDFASVILEGLMVHHQVLCVVTAADRRRGRGKKFIPTPVKEVALKNHIPVLEPECLNSESFKEQLSGYHFDLAVVVAYGKMIPEDVLSMAPLGFLNVHASLLPRWRGAAPIHRAIMAGDKETGVSIMKMDKGLDTGPVYAVSAIQIEDEDNTGTLFNKLAVLGLEELLQVISEISKGSIEPIPQKEQGVTYAKKIQKSMCNIDWSSPCNEIVCFIKGLNPYPCAKTNYNGEMWKIYKADCLKEHHSKKYGEIVSVGKEGIKIACGQGLLVIKELQKSGSKKMSATEFLRGRDVQEGLVLC